MKCGRILIPLFAGALVATNARAQQLPSFKLLRYDEDYSFLKKDSAMDFYERIKFVPLSVNRETYLTYGGEVRFQYFYTRNEAWGDAPQDDDGYILSRWLAHADLHAGRHFRAFVQLQSSLANSRIDPSPVDDNPLDLHQVFVDINPTVSEKTKLTFRLGRQEMMYGSQRLVSVRENPNNRQSFDALRTIITSGNYRMDAFYSHYVAAKPGIFDDGFNKDVKLWGAYGVRNKVTLVNNVDLYYLGLWKKDAMFNEGNGREIRHSIGTRIWKSIGSWNYDLEGLFQFGKFSDKTIAAWTASINTTYKFDDIKLQPHIGLKAELISGDKEKGDNKLQTFNPLFPKGAYFGLAALIGPANLVDLHPSVSLKLSEKANFDIDYDMFWRYSRNDGLYAVNVALIYPDGNTDKMKIGNQLAVALNYNANEFLSLRGEFTWFNAGSYLKEVGAGKDILFTGATVQFKF